MKIDIEKVDWTMTEETNNACDWFRECPFDIRFSSPAIFCKDCGALSTGYVSYEKAKEWMTRRIEKYNAEDERER